ncbi:MAG: relE [Nanoarchaeota archaeon]
MAYTIKFGKKFDREFEKIDKSISDQIVKKLKRLK